MYVFTIWCTNFYLLKASRRKVNLHGKNSDILRLRSHFDCFNCKFWAQKLTRSKKVNLQSPDAGVSFVLRRGECSRGNPRRSEIEREKKAREESEWFSLRKKEDEWSCCVLRSLRMFPFDLYTTIAPLKCRLRDDQTFFHFPE